jgi:hypothetical protein
MNHQSSQIPGVQLLAVTDLADFKILAKDTAKVAPREENGSRASPAAKHVLFAEMRKGASHASMPSNFANAELISPPVHPFAQSRANRAGRPQVRQGLLDFFFEPAFLMGLKIGRGEIAATKQEPAIAVNFCWN